MEVMEFGSKLLESDLGGQGGFHGMVGWTWDKRKWSKAVLRDGRVGGSACGKSSGRGYVTRAKTIFMIECAPNIIAQPPNMEDRGLDLECPPKIMVIGGGMVTLLKQTFRPNSS